MLKLVFSVLLTLFSTQGLFAQDYIPHTRLSYVSNTDFVGADLQQLFDTTQDACKTACLSDNSCVGFTFNSRSNACFPKLSISGTAAYEGAISARLFRASDAALARAGGRALDLGFLKSYEMQNAYRQAENIGRRHPNSGWSLETITEAEAARVAERDFLNAMRWAGVGLGMTDSSNQWVAYGLHRNAIVTKSSSDRRKHRAEALSAAINGYLRAETKAQRVNALNLMADTFELLGRGRDMIPALKLSNALLFNETTEARLFNARAKYGFRVVNTVVESNKAAPRICAEFSEPLSRSEREFSRFVATPDPRFALSAEGNRLCISGPEHGKRYEVNFRAGLPADSGEVLIKDTRQSFYVRDRAPELRFPGRGYILPLTGNASLPVETVNLDEVELTLRRVSDRNLLRAFQDNLFAKPLYAYEEEQLANSVGEDIWKGVGLVSNELNQTMTTRLPITQALEGADPGIYVMSAKADGANGASAAQWFVISNLGISSAAGTDGLHVFIRDLASANPLEGAKVKLLSRSNRILGEVKTDALGQASFSAAQVAGRAGAAPALVLAEQGTDMAFLSLTEPAFDLSDRGVSGREPAGPIDLFLTTERGAYRAGETVFATALARDSQTKAVQGLPLTARLLRPDGIEYSRQILTPDTAGGYTAPFPIAATAPRGAWTLEFKADEKAENLASTVFLVEDFLPERIDYEISLPELPLTIGTPFKAEINARYLFGAPAGGLKVDGRVSLNSTRTLEGYEGFRFGPHDGEAIRKSSVFPTGETGADGLAELNLSLPQAPDAMTPLTARFTMQVAEGSGRPVERRAERTVLPPTPLLGLKPLFEGSLPEGSEAAFDVIALMPDQSFINGTATWTLNRLNTRYQWYEQYGRWRWEPIVSRVKLASGVIPLKDGKATVAAPVDWGEFELVLELEGAQYALASERFNAGWYAAQGAVRTPDTLEISLDRQSYEIGDQAKLRILPRTAGQALVQVMGDSLISSQFVTLDAGENLVPLDVTTAWGAGAYVTVTHITPLGTSESFLPTRAIGLAYAKVDPAEKALSVEIQALDETKPRQPLNVRVKVGNVQAGEEAFVTLAAVDAGILNLTAFQPPDPSAHYFGKRKLGVELRDVYGRLIDASMGELGRLRSGGDAGASMGGEGTPPPEELVTFFKGPITINSDGYADVSLDVPAFNGTLRLMAMAWSPTGLGNASEDVVIADPVVLSASLPRFLSPQDTSEILVEIIHADGPTGDISLSLQAEGLAFDAASIPEGLTLNEGEKLAFSIPITALQTGDHEVLLTMTAPDGSSIEKRLVLPVRTLDPEVSQTRRLSLASGQSLVLDDNLLSSFKGQEGRIALTAGPIARFDVAGLLTTLDRYPYGCTEQLTSSAMPLLYMSSVSEALGLNTTSNVKTRIDGAIKRILTRQSSNGAFGLWQPSSGDAWLDAYVTDFLSRARSKGYHVPDVAFESAIGNLKNRVNATPDFDNGGGGLAYALYVLAREGKASVSDLRYYADIKSDAFSTPIGSAHLAAALALYGDQPRADAMFGKASLRLAKAEGRYRWRSDYGTVKRDSAALLALATAAKSDAVDVVSLAQSISGDDSHRSTQEMVWALLAVDALASGNGAQPFTLDGAPLTGPPALALSAGDLRIGKTLENTGERNTDITLTTYGVPSVAPQAGGYGYAIERKYFRLDGTEVVELDVKAGDKLVVYLRVTPFEKASARLMVNDPLPAGFEIDNPNLVRSGDIGALSWLKTSYAEHSEFRAERFLAAVNAREGKAVELAYIVRAVMPGTYHHPAATVEDMYRPTYRANSNSGSVRVRK